MSVDLVAGAAERRFFYPRQRFDQLAHDHVPFDLLTGRSDHERKALRDCVEGDGVVGVVGPRGGGKSSLIACVCDQLPDSHIALRIPVSGADDPTSTSVIASVALSQALSALKFEEVQRRELAERRADSRAAARIPGGVKGGKLGGGPVPAQLDLELESLREEVRTDSLAVDRLAGLERLIEILVNRDLSPVFVLEDTEAAIGGADLEVAEGFIKGPVHALVHEVAAACLIAIQDVFEPIPEFGHLAAGMTLVRVPSFDAAEAGAALTAIIERRLRLHEVDGDAADVLATAALESLVDFYVESGSNLRYTLAALQSASEFAAESEAEQIGAGHMHAGVAVWRARTSVSG